MLLMRVCWSLRDKKRVCVGCLQWDVLIGTAKTLKLLCAVFIDCFMMAYRIEILCNHVLHWRDVEANNKDGYSEWMKNLGASSARPVDNRCQLWSFSGNVVPHRVTYSSICWMIVLLRNQVWRRSIGQHFRRQHRIADSPLVTRLRSYPLPLSRRCCQSRVKFLLRNSI